MIPARWRSPAAAAALLDLFVAGNLGFLAVDIWLAHSMNRFAHWAEWIPLGFSCVAPVALAPGVVTRARGGAPAAWPGLAVGATAVVVGVAGLLWHGHGTFFREQTLHHLVYTAPFAAPLAYAGLGLLLLLNRTEDPASRDWARWVLLLSAGGFAGNLALALADHAQNGFFYASEWVPVVAAAFGLSFLTVVVARPADTALRRATAVVMAAQALVGLLGALLHGLAIARGPGDLWHDVIHMAPPFAPLLFADLAALAWLGLWRLGMAGPVGPPRVA